MKQELRFEELEIRTGDFGEEAGYADLVGSMIIKKAMKDEAGDPEVPVGYGMRKNSYPYRQWNTYTRELKSQKLPVAVLENDMLCACFLPTLGGRLFSLVDRKTGKNLLYTNDVIRFSNLAVCNAWFSGGVEWNAGIIGHSPFTTKQLYTARLSDGKNPVLRMYEFERIRGITYQMDFWLEQNSPVLFCRIELVNPGEETVPVYWWSNMAVPEYHRGRICFPATEAFSSDNRRVYKVPVPETGGIDISCYENIPYQTDYFFDISREEMKFIANLDEDGAGLLHVSTSRLQGRKLFCWGNNEAANNWQRFLTDKAGKYVEIQAGLPKTQYACVPMKGGEHIAWIETYGPVQLETAGSKIQDIPYRELLHKVKDKAQTRLFSLKLEEKLKASFVTSGMKARLVMTGSGYGALYRECAKEDNRGELPAQLEFVGMEENPWLMLLKTRSLPCPDPEQKPEDYVSDPLLIRILIKSLDEKNRENWFAFYEAGTAMAAKEEYQGAAKYLQRSYELSENAWSCHALASVYLLTGNKEEAAFWMEKGVKKRQGDLSYLKEAARLLISCGAYKLWLSLYENLPDTMKKDTRLAFDALWCRAELGEREAVLAVIRKENIVPDDLQECEEAPEALWKMVSDTPVPEKYRYTSVKNIIESRS